MEKMNVKLAVQLFSMETISVLKFLQENGKIYGIKGFENCMATIEFMENIYKWFSIHNVKDNKLYKYKNNNMIQHFLSIDDDRLFWLENDFLMYLREWKESISNSLEFLTEETYQALVLTTKSTALCIKYLLNQGFHYVLTRKFSSDDIEALFSAVRQRSNKFY